MKSQSALVPPGLGCYAQRLRTAIVEAQRHELGGRAQLSVLMRCLPFLPQLKHYMEVLGTETPPTCARRGRWLVFGGRYFVRDPGAARSFCMEGLPHTEESLAALTMLAVIDERLVTTNVFGIFL